MEGKYINPFTDFGFKKLFGSEFNKELLIDFINHVLEGKEKVDDITYINTEKPGITAADRKAIFDLYCRDKEGKQFIIELQNVKQEYFKDRSIYYATFALQEQAAKGQEWNYSLKPVYTICILNFILPGKGNREQYKRQIELIDNKTGEVFYDKLMFVYLEIPKFRKKEEELETHFDKWMYILKNLPLLQKRPKKLQEKIFKKLFKEAAIAQLNPKDMNAYQHSLKTYWDNYSTLQTMKKEGMEEGKKRGIKEGIKEGKKEGKREGKREGEKKAKLKIAKSLKEEGVEISLIIKVTALSEKEIKSL